jgi:uncharacterized protein YyaL (SSP411 family)
MSKSLQIALATEAHWLWPDHEIVINHKGREVSNYPSGYPYTNNIKYGRTANYIFKYINEKRASRCFRLEQSVEILSLP